MKKASLSICTAWIIGTGISGSQAAAAETVYTVDQKASTVDFLATGKPGFLKIRGEGAGLAGTIKLMDDHVTGELTATLTPLKTGIGLRDEHMHEKYLETGKYPTATLTLTTVKIEGSNGPCSFEGTLTIKNTGKPVTGSCEAEGVGTATMKVAANTEIKMADYPIGVPSHLGITVAETVTVAAKVVATRSTGSTN